MSLLKSFAVFLIAVLMAPLFLPDPPTSDDIKSLPIRVQEWYKKGKYIKIGNKNIFYINLECKNKNMQNVSTFVVLHGFPSSSFDYHKVIHKLQEYGNVFVHDHVGFGFSDKPFQNFTYSISEAAENSLRIWRELNIKNAHIVSHDMGDTVLTEILARRYRGLLPSYFDDFFRSVTFTNGGMKYSKINFRIGQLFAKNVYLGHYFCSLSTKLGFSKFFMKKQLLSLWGSDCADKEKEAEEITLLYHFNGGSLIFDKTIYYLWDRAHFEFRWFEALENIDLPTRFVWGDSDPVSPIEIPKFFQNFVPSVEFSVIEEAGHFWMLEKPIIWVENMVKLTAN